MHRGRISKEPISRFGNIFGQIEVNNEFQKKVIIGDILWRLHQKQGTESWLIQAIEPHLEKEHRLLFGLV